LPPAPLLYLRGGHHPGEIEAYPNGFCKAVITNITGKVMPSGHFSADESPQAFCDALVDFRARCDRLTTQ
jgi:hypothetical protein